MKKPFLSVLFLVLLTGLFAQDTLPDPDIPMNEKTKTIEFSKVVHEPGTKDELFKRCVYWLNSYYKSPTRVTQIRDVPTGKILGKHYFHLYTYDTVEHVNKKTAKVNYTFTIMFKDNRYKWQIDEMEVISTEKVPIEAMLNKNDPLYKKKWKSYLIQIADFVKNWSDNLEEKMKPEEVKQEKDDDW
jgi:hypothetical protein